MTEATREASERLANRDSWTLYIVRALVHEDPVRVAVRRPDLAAFLQAVGGVGQVQAGPPNLGFLNQSPPRLKAPSVIDATGVTAEERSANLNAVHIKGASALARAAMAAPSVILCAYFAGIGAEFNSPSPFASKGLKATRETFPNAVVLRPSVILAPRSFLQPLSRPLACYFSCPCWAAAETICSQVMRRCPRRSLRRSPVGDAGTTYELGGPRTMTLGEAAAHRGRN